MISLKTIVEVHALSGDRYGMVWSDKGLNNWSSSTYGLMMDEEDGMGQSDEIIQTDRVHVLRSGDGWRGWYRKIRWEVFTGRQLTNWTWGLRTSWRKRGMDYQIRGLKIIDQVHAHSGEGSGIGWSDEEYSNNWFSSRTPWRLWRG